MAVWGLGCLGASGWQGASGEPDPEHSSHSVVTSHCMRLMNVWLLEYESALVHGAIPGPAELPMQHFSMGRIPQTLMHPSGAVAGLVCHQRSF